MVTLDNFDVSLLAVLQTYLEIKRVTIPLPQWQ